MALTLSKIRSGVMGDLVYWLGTATFDSSYATGGESFTPSNAGMSDILMLQANSDDGYLLEWDDANSKILVKSAIRKYTASMDPASMTTDSASSLAVTVSGVASTDICIGVQPVSTLEAGIVVQSARVTAANQITVELTNASAATVDPVAGDADFFVVSANGAAVEVPSATDLSGLVAKLFVVGIP